MRLTGIVLIPILEESSGIRSGMMLDPAWESTGSQIQGRNFQIQRRVPKSKGEIQNPRKRSQIQKGNPKAKGETPNAKGRPQIQR